MPISFAGIVLAFSFLLATAQSQRVVKMPMQRRATSNQPLKRDTVSIPLQNYPPLFGYFVSVSVGTPPQTIELALSTVSSDILLFGPGSCNTSTSLCQGGVYNQQASTTARNIAGGKGGFSIPNELFDSLGLTFGSGNYITDEFAIGNTSITNMTIAVCTSCQAFETGYLGIGYAYYENGIKQNLTQYKNFPQRLVEQGKITTTAYSIYLDDLAATTGTVLFGGYDEAKFEGNLVMLPTGLPTENSNEYGGGDDGGYSVGSGDFGDSAPSFVISWTSLGISREQGDEGLGNGLFQGSTGFNADYEQTYLPSILYAPLAALFEANVTMPTQFETNITLVSCDFALQHPGKLIFGFGGVNGIEIPVDFNELILPLYYADVDLVGNTSRIVDSHGTPLCQFALVELGNGGDISGIFGQSFLRSAYTLFDLDNRMIGLAPASFDTQTSNVVEYAGNTSTNRIQRLDVSASDSTSPTATFSLVSTEFTAASVAYPTFTGVESYPASLAAEATVAGSTPGSSASNTPGSNKNGAPHCVSSKSISMGMLGCLIGIWTQLA